MTEPKWRWCPQAGMARTSSPKVDQADYGDGYVHRSTRGLNPLQEQWQISVPFADALAYEEVADFLESYAVPGFYMDAPDLAGPGVTAEEVFVYCDQWSCTVIDRTGKGDLTGTVSATFTRCYNPQPISAAASIGTTRRQPPPQLPPQLTIAVHPVPQELVARELIEGLPPVAVPRDDIAGPNMLPPPQPLPNMPYTPSGAER